MDMNPPPGLIEGLCSVGKVGMVYGPPSAGKTNFILDMLVKLAMGLELPFAGVPQRRIKSVYCTEEGLRDIPLRLKAAADANGWPPGENLGDYIRVCDRLPTLQKSGSTDLSELSIGLSQLRDECGFVPEILVVDTFANAIGDADENSNTDMTCIMRELHGFAQEEKLIVVLAHHSGKGNGENIRGASAIKGNLDFAINILPGTGYTKVRAEKVRDYALFKSKQFVIVASGKSCAIRWSEVASGDFDEGNRLKPDLVRSIEEVLGRIAPEPKLAVSSQKILDELAGQGTYLTLPTLNDRLKEWSNRSNCAIRCIEFPTKRNVRRTFYFKNIEIEEGEV
jgi:hypothetical protein